MNDIANDGFGNTSTTFAFSTSKRAFGGIFNLNVPGGPGSGLVVTLLFEGGGTQTIGTQIPNTIDGTFWGFITDMPFTEVRFSEGNQGGVQETYTLDNLQFTNVVIPEPQTATLMLSGLGALLFLAGRKRR
jgi:hypothetical protein